jgi:hypothetical protein
VTKTLDETLTEIENNQASLAKTIEDSKQLINRSQQLLDCRKQQLEAKRLGS